MNTLLFSTFSILLTGIDMKGHFRGGTLYIFPAKNSEDILQLNYRLSWTRSNTKIAICDANHFDVTQINFDIGRWTTSGTCNGNHIPHLPLECTHYASIDDLVTGIYVGSLHMCNDSYVEVRYTGKGWPEIRNGNALWSLYLKASLNRRRDTGLINRSPITLMRPIIRILNNCDHLITVPVADNDGDVIRCRWSTNENHDECGGACTPIHGVTLDEDECTLVYSKSSAEPGTYAVTIQIEDFVDQNSSIPLSSIPLQFIIEFLDLDVPCQYPSVTDTLKLVQTEVKIGESFKDTVIGTSKTNSQTIVGIDLGNPLGMERSDLQSANTITSNREWFVSVHWAPTNDQEGVNLFCFVAINNLTLTSVQRCVVVDAVTGESNDGEIINMTYIVSGIISTVIGGLIVAFITWVCCKRNQGATSKSKGEGSEKKDDFQQYHVSTVPCIKDLRKKMTFNSPMYQEYSC